jgi:hypothetical protein
VLSSSRSQALADTLDWLEHESRSGPVEIRIQTFAGSTLAGVLTQVTRRQVQVSGEGDPSRTVAAGDIAKIWVAESLAGSAGSSRWTVWFDYGSP